MRYSLKGSALTAPTLPFLAFDFLRRQGFYRRALIAGVVSVCLSGAPLTCEGRGRQAKVKRPGRIAELQRAIDLVSARQLSSAEKHLDSILKKEPDNARALNLLGVVRAEQLRHQDAEALFKRALTSEPNFADARANLALLYRATNRLAEAATEFEEALRLNAAHAASNLVGVLRRLASDAHQGAEFEKALAHLLRAKQIAPTDADVLFEFAMVALRLALHDDAVEALAAALKKRPDEPKLIYALARGQMSRGEKLESERLFRRYVALKPEDASGHYGLGHALASLQNNAEAKQHFARSLELQPVQTEAPYQLGLLAYAENEVEAARAWFAKVLARYGDHVGALVGMGLVNYNNKEYEQARHHLVKAIALDARDIKAHYYLGLTYARIGDKESARRELDIAGKLEREQKHGDKIILRLLEKPPAEESHQP
ncbi:MAG: tetratricopeptide repeat protein [Pyrinomonadaceae bacterium]